MAWSFTCSWGELEHLMMRHWRSGEFCSPPAFRVLDCPLAVPQQAQLAAVFISCAPDLWVVRPAGRLLCPSVRPHFSIFQPVWKGR